MPGERRSLSSRQARSRERPRRLVTNLTTRNVFRDCKRRCRQKPRATPSYRFYGLYDKVYREDVLAHAWDAECRSNRRTGRGPPGLLRTSREYGREVAGGTGGGATEEETYRAAAGPAGVPPEADGKPRPLGISTIRDRWCMAAAMLVLEPIFEADLAPEESTPTAWEKRPACRQGSPGIAGFVAIRKWWTPT